jgi:eukaryotic-like serine/threonine-protein kinase
MPVEHAENHVEKRLSSRERDEPEAVLRLRSEAALLARLSGLGITPRLLDSGEDGQGPWHRTERVRLPTLADRLASANAPLDPSWIERAVLVTFGALASLHEAADASGPLLVVHADLSPANIAIDDTASNAVVLDLDLAWWREGPARHDGAFRGTIAYVAPEVARGERPTPRSDLFSLAAALIHGVTGEPPRCAPSFAALLAMAVEAPLLRDEHARLGARGPGHTALVACLAHDPADRPASARSVLAAIPARPGPC